MDLILLQSVNDANVVDLSLELELFDKKQLASGRR